MATKVRTCFISDSLATQLMWDHDCGCVPVLNEQAQVVGMLTGREIYMVLLNPVSSEEPQALNPAITAGLS